jgi:hypothetical protein
MARPNDFSLDALFAALDAQRLALGLTWAAATLEINRESERRGLRRVSASTVKATRTQMTAEADGILQMLLWLQRTPESFVTGRVPSDERRAHLPEVPPHRILRFDTKKLHAALDTQRMERQLTWSQLARELGVGATALTHLAKGGRTAFPQVMRMVQWLGRCAAEFTRAAEA